MISDGEFVTKTSKGEELDGKKAPGRTGAERTGKMSRRACYFEGWDIDGGNTAISAGAMMQKLAPKNFMK